MNWDSFVPDLVVAVVGAAFAVLAAALTFLFSSRRREKMALQRLIEELHRRRAFVELDNPGWIEDAAEFDDFHRVAASVLSTRDEVARTRDVVRASPKFQDPLARMRVACNQYLELSEFDPNNYPSHLMKLRGDLSNQVHRLVSARRSLVLREPGAGSLDN